MPSIMMNAAGYVTPETNTNGHIRIKAFIMHGEGITIGDKVTLRDAGPTGTIQAMAVADGTNGQFGQIYPSPGLLVQNPVFYHEIQAGGGTIRTEIVWE